MNEVLFSEPAKHYLLSTDLPDETMLVTVSPTEVNVIIRHASPTQPETNLIAQSTVVDETTYKILLNQVNRVVDAETHDERGLAMLFLTRLSNSLELVENRRKNDSDKESTVVLHLKKGVQELLSQV